MPCQVCFDWRLPFAMHASRSADGAVVALRYEQWLLYYLHIQLHQAGHWSGDLALDQTLESTP